MYYHNMQNNVTDCGIAVLKTILQQFDRKLTRDFVKQISVQEGQGLSLNDLSNVMLAQGIHASSYEVIDVNELKKASFPSVAIVEQNGKNHYIVIHAFNNTNKEMLISDPAKIELEKIKLNEFEKIFSGYMLCVEYVEKNSAEKPERRLYDDIICTIPLSSKIKYSIISIIKWGLPIVLLFIIQFLFMFYIEEMNYFNMTLVFLLFVLLSVCYYYLSLVYQNFQSMLEKRISSKMTMEYLMSEIKIISNKKNTNDTEGIFWNIVISIIGTLQKFYLKIDFILVLMFIGIIGMLNWLYAIIIIFFIAIISIHNYAFRSRIKNRQVELIGASGEMSACIHEMTSSSMDLEIFSNEHEVEKHCNNIYDKYEKVRENIALEDTKMTAFYDTCSYIVMAIGMCIIFITYMEDTSFSSSSLMIAFYMTIFMIMNFKSTFQRWIEYQKSVNAIEYIELMINPETKKEEKTKLLTNSIQEIELDNLKVIISGMPILKEINFKAKKGMIIGITGENGSGKSTLAKTILGLNDIAAGEIKINGEKINGNLSETDIVKHISFYSAELYLYSDSVKNNINFSIFESEKISSKYSFMNKLDLEYLLFSNGMNISQGERQKILLDRCLEKKRSIYIFDEPGVNLDSESQIIMVKMLEELKRKDKIILIISHEKEILSCCDECYKMYDGKIYKIEEKR